MRIVHFDETFHPDFGYQINVLPKYQIKQGHEVFIVTAKLDMPHPVFSTFGDNYNIDQKDRYYEQITGVKIVRIAVKKPIWGRVRFKKGYREVVDNLKPDILFCHFNDTFAGIYFTIHCKELNYPVIFDSHMLEMASKSHFSKIFRFFYNLFLTPIIKRNNLVVIRTQDDTYVNKCLGIPLSQAPFISFGSDSELFKPDEQTKKAFRIKNNISEDDFVIVYTGKLDQAKGGIFIAETFKSKLLNKKNKNVVLMVIGNTSGKYGKEVEKIFKESENRIIRFPTQNYKDLPKFYQASDLSIFPRQCSLSFYDAQACALPVVSEDNNINIDRLRYGNGFNFKANNIDDFRGKIKLCIEINDTKYQEMKNNSLKYIKENFDYQDIAKKYTEILISEYNKFHKYGYAESPIIEKDHNV